MELVQTHCMKWGIAMFALTLWQARDKKFCGALSKATSPVALRSIIIPFSLVQKRKSGTTRKDSPFSSMISHYEHLRYRNS